MNKFRSPGFIEQLVIVLGLFYALLTKNPLLTSCAVISPFILMKLTWKLDESPVLFMAMLLQWTSITVKLFYANYNGLNFIDETLHKHPENILESYYLALLGLISEAFGIYLMIRGDHLAGDADLLENSLEFNTTKLSKFYAVFAVIYPILYNLSFSLGGLQQPLTKLLDFKWALFFIFMIHAFYSKNYKAFLLIAGLEFIFSFTGFFSGFKDYLILLFIGLIVVYKDNFKLVYLTPLAVFFYFGFYLLFSWQYIKPTYRAFLNGGQSTQTSIRTTEESLNKITDLAANIDSSAVKSGFKQTVDRISYIDFLSATISNVPENIAHTNGNLWLGAIERVLQPRILFPDKEAIDDSEKARLYTGDDYSGAEEGTSVSLGYFAESYVDFGKAGMHLVLFAFGLLIGLIYRYVIRQSPNILIGTAMIIPLFFIIYSYETALDKIFGALLLYFLIYLLVNRFALKPLLNYLKK